MPESARRLKICHVFAGTEGGRWVHDQLAALQRDGDCEAVAVLGGETGPTVDLCRSSGIAVKAVDFSVTGWRSLFSIPWRILRFAWWLRRERFDVVQSHVIQSTLFARPAAWLADVPVRLTMVTGPFYMQAPATRRMERSTAWMETGIIPSCELTGRLYRDAGIEERLIEPVHYYGPDETLWDPERIEAADLRAELGLPEDSRLIGSVAVFYPRCAANAFIPPEIHHRHVKGHEELIRAMPEILSEFPTARLLLVGKGWGPIGAQAEEELRQIVREAGVEAEVIFTGYRADVAAVYRALDVSVQASLNDNLGGTVESLLMARPTVATRVGGLVDSVVDGETGLLVEPGDPADLARGIRQMLRDPDAAAAMGERGRARMLARFTLATTVPGLAALYRRQRAAAPGAWRLRVSLWRLMVAGVLHPPILGRALIWDLYLAHIVPALWWSFVGRAWIIGLRLLGRLPEAAKKA